MTAPAFRIRRAMAADLPRLVELWRAMWDLHERADPRFASTPLAEPFVRRWLEENLEADNAVLISAVDASGPVVGYALGFVVQNPPIVPWTFYGHISEVAVDPAHRRRGIGRALVAELHRAFRERGCAYVEAFVAVANPEALAFWKRIGYRSFIDRMRSEL